MEARAVKRGGGPPPPPPTPAAARGARGTHPRAPRTAHNTPPPPGGRRRLARRGKPGARLRPLRPVPLRRRVVGRETGEPHQLAVEAPLERPDGHVLAVLRLVPAAPGRARAP